MVTKERKSWRTFYEVFDDMYEDAAIFLKRKDAEKEYQRRVDNGAMPHLHRGKEMHVGGEPVGEYADEDCLKRFDDGVESLEPKAVA